MYEKSLPKDDIEIKLDEADREAESSDTRHNHEEIFSRVKSRIKELESASYSSMDFWDNEIDDEVWNNDTKM